MIEYIFISNLASALLWGGGGGGCWSTGQTMAGDDICEWRPAYLRLTWYQLLLTSPSSQTLSVSVSLSHCLSLLLVLSMLILFQLKVYFLLAMRNFRFTLNFFSWPCACILFLKEIRMFGPKLEYFIKQYFTLPYNV